MSASLSLCLFVLAGSISNMSASLSPALKPIMDEYLNSARASSKIPNVNCVTAGIVGETQNFLEDLCGKKNSSGYSQVACDFPVVKNLIQGCTGTTPTTGKCFDTILLNEKLWFKSCMNATSPQAGPEIGLVCDGYEASIVPIIQMLDSSAKIGVMPLFIAAGVIGNSNMTDPVVAAGAITTIIELIFAYNKQQASTLYLGNYDTCQSLENADYWLVNAHLGTSQLSLGLCVPSACRSLNFSSINGPALTITDVSEVEESMDITKDKGAMAVIVLLLVFLGLGIIATSIDVWQSFMLFQKTGPNQTHLPNKVIIPNTYEDANDDLMADYSKEVVNVADVNTINGERIVSPQPRQWENKIIACFSVYRNLPKLLSTKKVVGSIDCFNGMRVLSLAWVVLGHTFLCGVFNPLSTSPLMLFGLINQPSNQWILNAFFSVDTFFYMGGFLVSYTIVGKLEKMKIKTYTEFHQKLPLWKLYMFRYFRLTPLYAVVIGVYATLTPYLGSGPMYQATQSAASEQICQKYWWTNLLYINVFFGSNGTCVGQSWYLANDFIFYLLSPFFIVPMHISGLSNKTSRRNKGLWFSVFVILVLSIGCAIHSVHDNIRANPLSGIIPNNIATFTQNNMYTNVAQTYYYMPWWRIQPYIVGMMFGYLFRKDLLPRRIPLVAVAIGFVMFFGIAYVMIWGLQGEMNVDCTHNSLSTLLDSYNPKECQGLYAPTDIWVDGIYNGFSRWIWAILLSMLTYFCHYGYGGPINKFLGSTVWLPFARVTFAAYLIHLNQLQVYYASKHTQSTVSVLGLFADFVLNWVLAYVLAFIAVIFIEFPMGQLFNLATKPPHKPSVTG